MADRLEDFKRLLDYLDHKALQPGNESFQSELLHRYTAASIAVPVVAEVTPMNYKVSEIHEYCIEDVLSDQAVDFYKNLVGPAALKTLLGEAYVRMERAARENEFELFALAVYQQFEGLTNHIYRNDDFTQTTDCFWESPAEPLYGHGTYKGKSLKELVLYDSTRFSERTMRNKVLMAWWYGQYKKMKFAEKPSKPPGPSSYWLYERSDEFSQVSAIRNLVHVGGDKYEKQQELCNRIMAHKSFYMFLFRGYLAHFVSLYNK